MSTERLTKRIVDSLRPRDKPFIAYDIDLKGFGVRVLPSGVKSWVVEYRPGVGRDFAKKRMTIGSVSTLTADEARKAARDTLASIRLGSDPLDARARERDATPVSILIDQFLVEHVEAKRKPKTAELYRHVLHDSASPPLAHRTPVARTCSATVGTLPPLAATSNLDHNTPKGTLCHPSLAIGRLCGHSRISFVCKRGTGCPTA